MRTTWARTNPCSMSLWMRPAACLAVQPRGSCQARDSLLEVAGEERDVAEHVVGGAHEHVHGAGLAGAELGAELGRLLGLQVGQLGLEAGGDGDHLVAAAARPVARSRRAAPSASSRLRRRRCSGRTAPGARSRARARGRAAASSSARSMARASFPSQQRRVQRLEDLQLALRRLVAAARRLARLVERGARRARGR